MEKLEHSAMASLPKYCEDFVAAVAMFVRELRLLVELTCLVDSYSIGMVKRRSDLWLIAPDVDEVVTINLFDCGD